MWDIWQTTCDSPLFSNTKLIQIYKSISLLLLLCIFIYLYVWVWTYSPEEQIDSFLIKTLGIWYETRTNCNNNNQQKKCVMCLLIIKIGAENVQNTHWITWSADSQALQMITFSVFGWIRLESSIRYLFQSFINNASYSFNGFWLSSWSHEHLHNASLEGVFHELVSMRINVIVVC